MRLRAAIIGCAAAISAAALGAPKWTPEHLDPFGYVPMTRFQMDSPSSRLWAKLKSKPNSAYPDFAKAYGKEPDSYVNYFGMLLAAKSGDDLLEAIERIAKKFQEYREEKLKQGNGRTVDVPHHFAIAYQLALSMIYSPDIPGGDADYLRRLRPTSSRWFGVLGSSRPVSEELTRAEAILYGSASLVRGQEVATRQVLQVYSDEHPEDAAVHMILCHAYSRGTVELTRGNKIVPVPDSEKPKPQLAKREALAAVKIDSNLLDANYFAGYYLRSENPKEAVRYWQRFLKLLPDGKFDRRREFVQTWLKSSSGN